MYYLTHNESVKAAALHMNIAPTYAYEFFGKSAVQAKLEEMRAKLGEEVLQKAANQMIGTPQFLDEHLAQIIANPRLHPTRGYSDHLTAARLLAELHGVIPKGKPQVRPAPVVATQSDQADAGGSDAYIPESDRKRQGIHDRRSEDVERRILGSAQTEGPTVGTKNQSSIKGAE